MRDLREIYDEVRKPDLKYRKSICPICRGFGKAKGKLSGNIGDTIGKCVYCNGTGIARKLR